MCIIGKAIWSRNFGRGTTQGHLLPNLSTAVWRSVDSDGSVIERCLVVDLIRDQYCSVCMQEREYNMLDLLRDQPLSHSSIAILYLVSQEIMLYIGFQFFPYFYSSAVHFIRDQHISSRDYNKNFEQNFIYLFYCIKVQGYFQTNITILILLMQAVSLIETVKNLGDDVSRRHVGESSLILVTVVMSFSFIE